MIDGRDEVIRFSKSKGAMTYKLDLVVHTLEGTVGDPEFGPGQETGKMILDEACKVDNRLEPGVSRPPEPLFEMGLSPLFLKVIPKPLKFFFQVVSPDDREIEFEQVGEPSVFFGSEVPRVLQQDEAGLFEIDSLLVSQSSDFRSSDLVDGPAQVLNYMEPIEDQGGLRGMVLNRSQIRCPHIQADGLEGSSFAFPQPLEELVEGLLLSVQSHPQQSPSFQIIDYREIAVPLLARNLIDAQDMQGLDLSQLQSSLHHSFDDCRDHLPIQFKVFSHFLEGQLLCQQSNGSSQTVGDSFPLPGPRHPFHSQSASRADDSKGTVDDPERFISDRKILPTSLWPSSSDYLRFSSTVATSQTTIPQPIDPRHPSFFGIDHLGYPMGFHSQALSDISLHTHRPLISFLLTRQGNKRSCIRFTDAFPVLMGTYFS